MPVKRLCLDTKIHIKHKSNLQINYIQYKVYKNDQCICELVHVCTTSHMYHICVLYDNVSYFQLSEWLYDFPVPGYRSVQLWDFEP